MNNPTKIEANLLDVDRLNTNGYLYIKDCIEKYLNNTKEQQEANGVPIIKYDYDEYGDIIFNSATTIGAGSLSLKDNTLVFSGCITSQSEEELSNKYAVTMCTVELMEDEKVLEITPNSLHINIAESSAYYDSPNIKVN